MGVGSKFILSQCYKNQKLKHEHKNRHGLLKSLKPRLVAKSETAWRDASTIQRVQDSEVKQLALCVRSQ